MTMCLYCNVGNVVFPQLQGRLPELQYSFTRRRKFARQPARAKALTIVDSVKGTARSVERTAGVRDSI